MPYLHFETDVNRATMSSTIKQVEAYKDRMYPYDEKQCKDVSLIAGYLNDSNLHVRRTLDQFKHHSINTEKRDVDQVVYRYCKDHPFPYEDPKNKLKVFMVDQLWIWILSNSKYIYQCAICVLCCSVHQFCCQVGFGHCFLLETLTNINLANLVLLELMDNQT